MVCTTGLRPLLFLLYSMAAAALGWNMGECKLAHSYLRALARRGEGPAENTCQWTTPGTAALSSGRRMRLMSELHLGALGVPGA